MSVASEITRIQNAKASLKTSINAKTDQQHQITNEKIDDYSDFVDSITSGGGISINSLSDYTDYMEEIGIKFDNFINSKIDLYPVYTENAITIYTPEINCKNYIIHKKSNGKYRILWSLYNYGCIIDDTSVGFFGLTVPNEVKGNTKPAHIRNAKNIKQIQISITSDSSYFYSFMYYSGEFNTLNELISAITSPNGNISYSIWNGGFGFGAGLDSPYLIPYSNIPIIDRRNNGFEPILSQRLSNNETIELKQ